MKGHQRRLEEKLAGLVDPPSPEAYHRMRADLYASVLAQFLVPNGRLTKNDWVDLAGLALTAEDHNPELKRLESRVELRRSKDNPNGVETREK